MDFGDKEPEPWYDLNADAIGSCSAGEFSGIIRKCAKPLLATYWHAQWPDVKRGVEPLKNAAVHTAVHHLEKALAGMKFDDVPEEVSGITVAEIPGSSWVIIDAKETLVRRLLLEQAVVYHPRWSKSISQPVKGVITKPSTESLFFFRKIERLPTSQRTLTITGVKPTLGADEAIRQALQKCKLADGGRFEEVSSVYRGTMKKTGQKTSEAFAIVHLKKGTEERITDHYGRLEVALPGGKVVRSTVSKSPLCAGCQSRDHIISTCPWLDMGLMVNNIPPWVVEDRKQYSMVLNPNQPETATESTDEDE